MFARYAIYYTPAPDTALAEFGADWLGWDTATGLRRQQRAFEGADIGAITKQPRKYGFHGTLKPPFRLAEGCSAADVAQALALFCRQAESVTLDGLALAQLGRFLALVPMGDTGSLAALAASVVRQMDQFRAPLTATELANRRRANLTPAQDANLVAWGYPYVLDQFRFHMTLTGPLNDALRGKAFAELQTRVSELNMAPHPVTSLTLLGEDREGMFHQIQRFPLSGKSA